MSTLAQSLMGPAYSADAAIWGWYLYTICYSSLRHQQIDAYELEYCNTDSIFYIFIIIIINYSEISPIEKWYGDLKYQIETLFVRKNPFKGTTLSFWNSSFISWTCNIEKQNLFIYRNFPVSFVFFLSPIVRESSSNIIVYEKVAIIFNIFHLTKTRDFTYE